MAYRRTETAYRPRTTFTVPAILLAPEYKKINGVRTKTYPGSEDGLRINISFRTYGGTEREVNGVYAVEDTAEVETWYTPEITGECVIELAENGARYEILGEPENISMRNQFLKFKVRRIKGGV